MLGKERREIVMAGIAYSVIARSADQRVAAETTVENVIASASVEHVVLLVSGEHVVAAGASDVLDADESITGNLGKCNRQGVDVAHGLEFLDIAVGPACAQGSDDLVRRTERRIEKMIERIISRVDASLPIEETVAEPTGKNVVKRIAGQRIVEC